MTRRNAPKFGFNGTKHGTKGEHKHRDNHKNRRRLARLLNQNGVNSSSPMQIRILYKIV